MPTTAAPTGILDDCQPTMLGAAEFVAKWSDSARRERASSMAAAAPEHGGGPPRPSARADSLTSGIALSSPPQPTGSPHPHQQAQRPGEPHAPIGPCARRTGLELGGGRYPRLPGCPAGRVHAISALRLTAAHSSLLTGAGVCLALPHRALAGVYLGGLVEGILLRGGTGVEGMDVPCRPHRSCVASRRRIRGDDRASTPMCTGPSHPPAPRMRRVARRPVASPPPGMSLRRARNAERALASRPLALAMRSVARSRRGMPALSGYRPGLLDPLRRPRRPRRPCIELLDNRAVELV